MTRQRHRLTLSAAPGLHALALVSGALGLVYEVLWMRRFTVHFGATGPATAATLAAVFLGFAAGSAVLGSRSGRWRRPLLVFGMLEMGTGLAALFFGPLLRVGSAVPWLHGSLPGGAGGSVLVKLVLAVIATFVPTFLMGGALPALVQAWRRGASCVGVTAGGLYAAQVGGGALGALAVPFVLLPAWGSHGAYGLAVAGSIVVGGVAIALAIARGDVRDGSVDAAVSTPTGPSVGRGASIVALLAFASGTLTLGLEVLWTRMLSLVHENSTQSFATVLAVFLVGLAGGAGLARGLLRRGRDPRRVLWLAWSVAALLTLLSPHVFVGLTSGLSYLPAGAAFGEVQLRLAGVAAGAFLPAVILAGTVLPCLIQLAQRQRDEAAGVVVGRVLAWNLLGSLTGPLLVAFGPVPRLGLWWAIVLGAFAMALAAALAAGAHPARYAAPALCGLLLVVASPADLPRVRLDEGERLRSIREGPMGLVAVVDSDHGRRMSLNNYYVIGGTASTGDERWQGHLPLLLHPRASSVAFLGLGTGITAGAAVLHPVREIVAIEIVPEIVVAARDEFVEANLGLAADPRVEIVRDDARTWLRHAGRRFDVIVGDLVVPWRRGESALYTLEHFDAARRALAPDGLFCQWVPAFQLSREELRIVARTFLEVFPRASVWLGDFRPGEAAIGFVGLADERAFDPAAADRNADELAGRDPSNPYLAHRAGLWLHLVGEVVADDAWLAGAAVNRDATPWIELASPRQRTVFVGADLTGWLDDVRGRSPGGIAGVDLGGERLRWRGAGAALWQASILAEAGRLQDADALGLATLRELPAPIPAAFARPGAESGAP